jgi:DNA-binding NarL/FixJ family response regulator
MRIGRDTSTTVAESEYISRRGAALRLHRVFLADDHDEMRRTVASMLSQHFWVVGLAKDARGVLELAPGLSPDVLVIDICMPRMNGIEAVFRLKTSGCKMKSVFLTVNRDPDFLEAAMSMGIAGYVFKPHLWTDLVPAIWTVLQDQNFVSPALSCAFGPARVRAG